MFESMIQRYATEQHAAALRRAEITRQVRGGDHSHQGHDRPGGMRRGVARHLVAVAGRLDPASTAAERPVPDGSRRAA